jgi:hypothetical protein
MIGMENFLSRSTRLLFERLKTVRGIKDGVSVAHLSIRAIEGHLFK